MYKRLIEEYRTYCGSEEHSAEILVRRKLEQSKGMWIDIISSNEFGVVCELYPKKIKPKFPPKEDYKDAWDYVAVCRAISWNACREDVKMQKKRGLKGRRYCVGRPFIKNKKLKWTPRSH